MNLQQTESGVLKVDLIKRGLWGLLVLAIGLFLLFLFYPFPEDPESERAESSSSVEKSETKKDEAIGAVDSASFDSSQRLESPGPVNRTDEMLLVLPTLRDSDEFVLGKVSEWDLPVIWMDNESLISRFTALVTSVSAGELPRKQLDFLAPKVGFKVFRDGEKIYVNPENYRRFDALVDSIESLPLGGLSGLLRESDPLFRLSLRQLGMPGSPESYLLTALDRVIRLPTIPPKVELIQAVVVFQFADTELEALPEFEKQLIRMGPMNVERLRNFARKLKSIYLKT